MKNIVENPNSFFSGPIVRLLTSVGIALSACSAPSASVGRTDITPINGGPNIQIVQRPSYGPETDNRLEDFDHAQLLEAVRQVTDLCFGDENVVVSNDGFSATVKPSDPNCAANINNSYGDSGIIAQQ